MSLKTKVLVVLLILAIIPATALGTVTRVKGLGGWPGTAYIVKDASNPVQFPSTLAYYSHLLYAELKPALMQGKLGFLNIGGTTLEVDTTDFEAINYEQVFKTIQESLTSI